MEVKIIEKRNIKTAKGQTYKLFKVLHEGQKLWVSEADFHQIDYPKVNNDLLVLEEPVNEQYQVMSKKNRKGMFLMPNSDKETEIKKEDKSFIQKPKTIKKINRLLHKPKLSNSNILRKNDSRSPKNFKEKISSSSPEKIAFITKIIELSTQKKTSENTRNRLINLIGEEVGRSSISREEVERIVEEKIGIVEENKEKDREKKIIMHSPKNMVRFLQQFSKDEKLKWFTHDPDFVSDSFDTKEYIKNAEKLLPKFPKFPINNLTYFNIRNFIFDTGYPCWGNEGTLKNTWKDAQQWALNNPGKHPYFANINNESFAECVHQFKNIIEFRTDNPDLFFYNRVKREVVKILGVDFMNKKLESDSFKQVGFSFNTYIDTNLFFKGLKQILAWIHQNKAKSNEVVLSLIDEEEYYIFEILHKKSYLSIDPNSEKLNGMQGDFDKTRKNLFGVVDWIIQADFRISEQIKNFDIYCLDANTSLMGSEKRMSPTTVKETNEKIEGVKHVLKIYKTVNL